MGKLPALPSLLTRKIYKTSQTRGAEDDEIYQNRVGRNNTVLIPFHQWQLNASLQKMDFEKGFIVLINPFDYFQHENPDAFLLQYGLKLGENCLVFYETRKEWNLFSPEKMNWNCATSRVAPLNGKYVARVPATTAVDEKTAKAINQGFTSKNQKGAGIRLYEYASSSEIEKCRLQLEAIFWLCKDSVESVCEVGMSFEDAKSRREKILKASEEAGLLNYSLLREKRIINDSYHTICPLCLKELTGKSFMTRLAQPEGREVPDLTVTEVNLFHIEELKYGAFNHRIYNLGWGCHFCNVVVKDSGIKTTLNWMKDVLERNNLI